MLKEGSDYKLGTDHLLSIFFNNKWESILLDGYQFKSVIAAGANGVTVKAYHKVTARIVAIKVWKPRKNRIQDYQQQFYEEVRKIAKLNHPNIVVIYDGQILQCGLCLAVYQFIDGITLKEWLEQEHSNYEKLDLCKTILDSIKHYQKQGVIHGDLHTGNILITPKGEISIIDFGTSLFSRENQSRDRELYLVVELVSALLDESNIYCSEHFLFSNIGKKIKAHKGPLLYLQIEPLLLTETLREYANIVELLYSTKHLDRNDIVDLCGFASRTSYLNICEFMTDVKNHYLTNNIYTSFLTIMDENIEEIAFPSYIEDYDEIDMKYQASAAAYYELAREVHPNLMTKVKLSFNDTTTEEAMRIKYNMLILELNKHINGTTVNSYFSILPEIQAALKLDYYEIQELTREILFYSLDEHFKNPFAFKYWVNARMREMLCDKSTLENIREAMILNCKLLS